jgi:DNA replication and repair protein RecF
MKIVSAKLQQFRNHTLSDLQFGTATNVLLGNNGQGKTNVLEALSYLCLTKSFYAGSDSTVVQHGKDSFSVEGSLLGDNGSTYSVHVDYKTATGDKNFLINKKEVETFSSVIGQFPLVVLSPENSSITFGTPSHRRKFVDLVIAQSSKVYLDDLIEYRKALRQRNKILSDARGESTHQSALQRTLESWDETIARYGARIIHRRLQFIREFAAYMTESYTALVAAEEHPSIEYESALAAGEERADEFRSLLLQKLAQKRNEEFRFGTTLVGPHRDEFLFSISGLPLRAYASQGQHKTFLVALKVAEFFYLKERVKEVPVFLLDDVFSELDSHRAERLLSFLGTLGQTFITATNEQVFHGSLRWNGEAKKIYISNGMPVAEQPAEKV